MEKREQPAISATSQFTFSWRLLLAYVTALVFNKLLGL